MKLYNWQFAPNCRRVRMFILEKGLQLPEMPEVVVLDESLKVDPGFVSLWPPAMVPLLELDDGTRISEALAIVRYIEDTHPEINLLGKSPLEAARVMMWERPAYDEGIVGTAEVVRNGLEVFRDRALPGVPNEPVPQIPQLVERGKGRVRRYYEKIEKQLASNKFMAGDRFTFADITNLCAIDFAIFAGMPIPENCASVRRWHMDVSARPAAIASA